MPRNAISTLFALFSFSLFLWQLGESVARATTNINTLHYWDNIFSYGWILFGPLGLHFSLLYTGKRNYSGSFIVMALIYLPAVWFGGTYQAGLYPHHFVDLGFFGLINPHNENIIDIVQLNWISLMVFLTAGILGYYAYQQRHNPLRKHQSLIIAIGLVIPTLQGFTTQVFFPIVLHLNPIPVTSTFLSCFSIATFIALNKYKLFNLSELARIDSILENTKDVVFTISLNKVITYINPYGAKMLGWNRADIESYRLEDFFPPGSDDSVQFKKRAITPALNGEAIENIYLKIKSRNGAGIPVLITAEPIFNNNQLQGVLVVARNISELQDMQDKLRSSEKRFRTLIEKSSDAIGLLTEEGAFTYISPTITRICGYRQEEFAYKKLFDFLSFRQKAPVATLCRSLLMQPGKSLSVELKIKNNKGDFIWIEGVATNLLNDPDIKSIIFNIRDITERKMAEEAMTNKNTELQKINTELDQFVYSASHDLRLPITNLMGLIEVTDLETEQQQKNLYLKMMRSSVGQLDSTIKEILDYSQNNRMEVAHEKIDLQELITGTFANLAFIDGATAIQKIVNVHQQMPCYSDKVRIKFILNNLITNAIKYHHLKQEQPYIAVRASVTDQKTIIIIQDNGSGIKESSINMIFDMFYRASTQQSGAGLGLYIVKEAVQRLGGTVSVESKEKVGSTFTVEIPNYSVN